MNRFILSSLMILPSLWPVPGWGQTDLVPPVENAISRLYPDHPRLLLRQHEIERIDSLSAKDRYAARLLGVLIREADASLADSLIVHRKLGKRLLQQCRKSLSRIMHLSLAFRLTGEQNYLERAQSEMLAAARLPDWNPSHFLDVAEMAAALAIGYDWLYPYLDPAIRDEVRQSLVDKALQPGFAQPHWWVTANNNWNQVCNTGLTLAALAIAEDEPEWAEKAVTRACSNILYAMKSSYEPMGVYPEGPGYWDYGTNYNVLLIAALESALGSDFGLSEQPGFASTALYRLLVVGPDGSYFKYSDCGEIPQISPALHWLARKFDQPGIARAVQQAESRILDTLPETGPPRPGRLFPLSLLWYAPHDGSHPPLPLEYWGKGMNPIALFRSGWDDRALWLACKGGDNKLNHNHMDAGQFVVHAGGIRWVEDFGADDYTTLERLPGNLWGEGRYDFFRTGIQSHSTLIINHQSQEIEESGSPIIDFSSSPVRAHAVIDLSRPWRMQAESVLRGVAMIARKSVLVQDEIIGAKGEILWQVLAIDNCILRGNRALLRKDGQTFMAVIIAPQDAVFENEPIRTRYKEENQNLGYTRLLIRIPEPRPVETIVVRMGLQPAMKKYEKEVVPLSQWMSQN
jgi:hypothetical protein